VSAVSSSEEIVKCPSCGQNNRIRDHSQTERPICGRCGEALAERTARLSKLREIPRRIGLILLLSFLTVVHCAGICGLVVLALIVPLAIVGVLVWAFYVFGWWATPFAVLAAAYAAIHFFFGEYAFQKFSTAAMVIGGTIYALFLLFGLFD